MTGTQAVVEDILRTAAFEQTALDAYQLLARILTTRVKEMDEEVWNPRLTSRRYVRLRARRAGVLEALSVIEALVKRSSRAPGEAPAPPAASTLRRPRGTYGSG